MTDRTLVLSSPPDDLDTVQDYIQQIWAESPELDSMDKLKFETALVELAANIIQHANGGRGVEGSLSITIDDAIIRARITDSSGASNVALENRQMPDEMAESGRGIAFIQRLVDTLHYERRNGQNMWMIEKVRESSAE